MTGPRFFGWVIGASHPVGVAADWITFAWGQNAGTVATPAAAAAEAVAARWLLDILDLPPRGVGRVRDGSTVANFTASPDGRGELLPLVGEGMTQPVGLFGAPPSHVRVGADGFHAGHVLGICSCADWGSTSMVERPLPTSARRIVRRACLPSPASAWSTKQS